MRWRADDAANRLSPGRSREAWAAWADLTRKAGRIGGWWSRASYLVLAGGAQQILYGATG